MRSIVSSVTVCLSIAITTIILLPTIVSADTQQIISEVVTFDPAAADNNKNVNIANETITYNIDTWNPRPEGIFVGGTVEESLMQLNEIGTDAMNHLSIATLMKFNAAFLSNGASQFVVRMPLYIEDNESDYPLSLILDIYSVTSPVFSFSSGGPFAPGLTLHYTGSLRADCSDVGNFISHGDSVYPEPIYTDISHDSWISEHRAYARIVAPVKTTELYLFVLSVTYPVGLPFKFYWNPSDLCSDNITSSQVAYSWNVAPDQNLFVDSPVNADAGWSFVFQQGLGADSRDWSYYYEAYSVVHWHKWLKVNSGGTNASGAFTFVMEFRKNSTIPLVYNLTVDAVQPWGSGGNIHLLSPTYWHDKQSVDMIIAGNPTNNTIVTYSGWILLEIYLQIQNAGRLQMMLEYDRESPSTPSPSNYFEILRPYASELPLYTGYLEQQVWFAPFCSATLANSTWNRTDEITPKTHKDFWSGLGSWWDKHWVDVVGVLMIIGGVALILTGVGAGYGVALIVGGIGLLLYHNIDAIRHTVDRWIQTIVDAIQGLGNWLYKIGMMIWKALQWLVDQIVYYGSIMLGLLIVGAAMALLVFPLKWEMEILGGFEALVQGDIARARKNFGQATKSMHQVGGALSGGRL